MHELEIVESGSWVYGEGEVIIYSLYFGYYENFEWKFKNKSHAPKPQNSTVII